MGPFQLHGAESYLWGIETALKLGSNINCNKCILCVYRIYTPDAKRLFCKTMIDKPQTINIFRTGFRALSDFMNTSACCAHQIQYSQLVTHSRALQKDKQPLGVH